MDILFEEWENGLIIRLRGELDHHSSIAAKERIELKLSCGCYQKILYSLEELSFMDSSGISLVANGCKIASVLGAKVFVYTENPKHKKIFLMAKMDEMAELTDNRKELDTKWKLSTK